MLIADSELVCTGPYLLFVSFFLFSRSLREDSQDWHAQRCPSSTRLDPCDDGALSKLLCSSIQIRRSDSISRGISSFRCRAIKDVVGGDVDEGEGVGGRAGEGGEGGGEGDV